MIRRAINIIDQFAIMLAQAGVLIRMMLMLAIGGATLCLFAIHQFSHISSAGSLMEVSGFFSFGVALLGATARLAYAGFRHYIPVRSKFNTRCRRCDYELRGSMGSEKCPECGALFNPHEVESAAYLQSDKIGATRRSSPSGGGTHAKVSVDKKNDPGGVP